MKRISKLILAGLILMITGTGASLADPTIRSFVAIPGNAQVTLAWNPVPNASGYNVKQARSPTGLTKVVATNISQTSLVVTNLKNEVPYLFAISAVVGGIESDDTVRLIAMPSAPFLDIMPAGAKLKKLASGFLYLEGPLWIPDDGGYLIFCDVYGDRMLRWTPSSGVTTFRQPNYQASGNALDLQGRLITTEHTSRRVTRTETNGTIIPLVTTYNGKTFNEPNDLAVKSDGTVWFTDPTYSNSLTQPGQWVYRFNPDEGNASVTPVAKDLSSPNGICFSPDESRLYVADYSSGVRVYDVRADGSLANSRVFVRSGSADGIKADRAGRIFVASQGGGLRVFNPDGNLLGTLRMPESPSNLCFGGKNQESLFITAGTNLFGVTRKPDLIVTAISLFPANPSEGQLVSFTAVVKNQGTGTTTAGTPLRVAFSFGKEKNIVWSDTFATALPPDASVLLTANGGVNGPSWVARKGEYTITATVDNANRKTEEFKIDLTLPAAPLK